MVNISLYAQIMVLCPGCRGSRTPKEKLMARWIEILQTYDIDIVHRPGNSDGLSRRPCKPCDYCSRREMKDSENQDSENTEKHVRVTTTQPSCSNTTDMEWYTAFSTDDLRKMQENDPVIAKVLQSKIKGVRPMWNEISPDSPVVKTYGLSGLGFSLKTAYCTENGNMMDLLTLTSWWCPQSCNRPFCKMFMTIQHQGIWVLLVPLRG